LTSQSTFVSFYVIAQNPVEIYCFFRAWVSFFAYALKYNVRLVVVSKLGNIDGSYNSKVKLLLPNFETTWQGALLEGHNKKRHPCPSLNY
jgi:hypothetical protein